MAVAIEILTIFNMVNYLGVLCLSTTVDAFLLLYIKLFGLVEKSAI
jgi:hypothetical protein